MDRFEEIKLRIAGVSPPVGACAEIGAFREFREYAADDVRWLVDEVRRLRQLADGASPRLRDAVSGAELRDAFEASESWRMARLKWRSWADDLLGPELSEWGDDASRNAVARMLDDLRRENEELRAKVRILSAPINRPPEPAW